MTNRQLDKWIHMEIFKQYVPLDHDINHPDCDCVPRYTESRSDAFRIVEKMVEDENSDFYEWQFELGNNHIQAKWYAVFSLPGTVKEFWGYGETVPLAISLAAKAAVEREYDKQRP